MSAPGAIPTFSTARRRLEGRQLIPPPPGWNPLPITRVDPDLPRFLPQLVHMGERELFPVPIARPIVYDSGTGTKLVTVVKDCGRGPLQLSDLQVGDTIIVPGRLQTGKVVRFNSSPVGAFQYECLEGRAGDGGLTLFPLQIAVTPSTATIPFLTSPTYSPMAKVLSAKKTTMVDVAISFPSGLSYKTTSKGVTTFTALTCQLVVWVVAKGQSAQTTSYKGTVVGYDDGSAFTFRMPYLKTGQAAEWTIALAVNGFKDAVTGKSYQGTAPKAAWVELVSRGENSIAGAQGHALVVLQGDLAGLGSDPFVGSMRLNAAAELKETRDGAATKTRNPTAAYLDVLQGAARPDPLSDSRIDATTISAWKSACASAGLTFDFTFGKDGGKTETQQALAMIAAAGMARPIIRDGVYSVVREPSGSPVEVFCPANIKPGFRVIRDTYGPGLHGIRCSIQNRASGFRDESFIVYASGYSASNASLFEDWSFDGTTSKQAAANIAAYHLAVLSQRLVTYEFPTDIEHLRVMRGDLVRMAHWRTGFGLSWGRVVDLPSATELDLSRECPQETGGVYRVLIRSSDGTMNFIGVTTLAGNSRRLICSAAHGAAVGDLFVFGTTAIETEECVVLKVQHGSQLTAVVTLAPLNSIPDGGFASLSLKKFPTDAATPSFASVVGVKGGITWGASL